MYSSTSVLFGICIAISCVHISVALIGDTCVGGRCPNNEQDGICVNSRCACASERIVSNDRMRCLLLATIVGSGCDEDAQCSRLGLSFCTMQNQCGCKPEATVLNNMCVKKQYLNDPCQTDQECSHIPQGTCDFNSRICVCTPQYVISAVDNAVCLPLAVTWMSPCNESIQCQGFGDAAICKDMKMCSCKESYHPGSDPNVLGPISPVKTTCIPDRGLSAACERKDQCYLPRDGDNQNVDCLNSVCKCMNDKKPSKDNQSCNGVGSMAVLSVFWSVVLALIATSG